MYCTYKFSVEFHGAITAEGHLERERGMSGFVCVTHVKVVLFE